MPGGGEITGTPVTLGVIQPGKDTIVAIPWQPMDPRMYDPGGGSSLAACFLARIEETPSYPYGMAIPELQNQTVKTNVKNNNNIVTRNMVVQFLNHNAPHRKSMVWFANAETEPHTFSLQLLQDKDIQKHFGGDLSQLMTATLYLGDLYDRWLAGGAQGSPNIKYNSENKSIGYDFTQPVRLDNIQLNPDEGFMLTMSMDIKDGIQLNDAVNDRYVFLRQLQTDIDVPQGTPDNVYGNITFSVNITPDDQINWARKTNTIAELPKINQYFVYPNPVGDVLNYGYTGNENVISDISITDVTGRVVGMQHKMVNAGKQTYTINTAGLLPGFYMIRFTNNNGAEETFKISKIH